MPLTLPKGYLSHSQIELWKRSKKDYRIRYYEGKPMYITPELTFGKKIAEQYEALHTDEKVQVDSPVLQTVSRGNIAEYKLECELNGVPVLGFIDSFDESNNTIYELKTGKVPWTQARVERHQQLLMYASCVKALHGKYNPYVKLIWLKTHKVDGIIEIDGVKCSHPEIQLTGDKEEFIRIVHADELVDYQNEVEEIARAISEDYSVWKRLHYA